MVFGHLGHGTVYHGGRSPRMPRAVADPVAPDRVRPAHWEHGEGNRGLGGRLPADVDARRPRRAGAPAGPGDPGRRDRPGHDPGPLRLGMAELPAVLLPPRGHATPVCSSTRRTQQQPTGAVALHWTAGRGRDRPHSAKVLPRSPIDGLSGTVRLEWAALDAWFEEDEQVFVHPRNPYARVDALRSTRTVGSSSTASCWPNPRRRSWCSRPACPPGTTSIAPRSTSNIWSPPTRSPRAPTRGRPAATGRSGSASAAPRSGLGLRLPDPAALPIAGLIAFYNEKVDIILDGELQVRPVTHFS